jgi:acyl carrier protein
MTDVSTEMIKYITEEVIHRPGIVISADTALVSSGLIDSFALVDILAKLASMLNMRIAAGKVRPKDLDTVRSMIETAERVGKKR